MKMKTKMKRPRHNRRDNSPLTNEELEPYDIRMDELVHLYMDEDITRAEFEERYFLYRRSFPYIDIEGELAMWNNHVTWQDSLGNRGYWIEHPRMSKKEMREYRKQGIKIYKSHWRNK